MVRGGSAEARIVVNIDVQGEPMGKRRRPVLEYGLLRLCIERVVSHRLGRALIQRGVIGAGLCPSQRRSFSQGVVVAHIHLQPD